MPHALAAALEEPGRVGQRSAIVEAHRSVARESIDVSEGGVADAGGRAAVVNQLADIATAGANSLEPWPDDDPEWIGDQFEPGLDGGITPQAAS